MIEEFDVKMQAGYNLDALLKDVEIEFEKQKRPSYVGEKFIKQVD